MGIPILVNGAAGKMGQIAIIAIEQDPELDLVATAGREDDLASVIKKSQAKVVIDVTSAEAAFENTYTILMNGAYPVIGTSGLVPEKVAELCQVAAERKLGGIVVPNFSLSAMLMMKYAKQAASYFPCAEIIELHHEHKKDAPSATAIKTAALIAEYGHKQSTVSHDYEVMPRARGAEYRGVPIHAVRIPGVMSQQEVIFGSPGETLRIISNIASRDAYIAGIRLACHKVIYLNELIYGLEELI